MADMTIPMTIPTPSLVSSQNEASHQNRLQLIAEQMLSAWAAIMPAIVTSAVNSILNPGMTAKAVQETLEADIPGEQIRTKGAQTTPPPTA